MKKIFIMLLISLMVCGCVRSDVDRMLAPAVQLKIGKDKDADVGSGMMVKRYSHKDGKDIVLIMTAFHVLRRSIELKKDIIVKAYRYDSYGYPINTHDTKGILVGGNMVQDIGFLFAYIPKEFVKIAKMAYNAKTPLAETIYICASSLGLPPMVDIGILGGYDRVALAMNVSGIFTGGVEGGCSGGGIFNKDREIIGVLFAYGSRKMLHRRIHCKNYGYFVLVNQQTLNNFLSLVEKTIKKNKEKGTKNEIKGKKAAS